MRSTSVWGKYGRCTLNPEARSHEARASLGLYREISEAAPIVAIVVVVVVIAAGCTSICLRLWDLQTHKRTLHGLPQEASAAVRRGGLERRRRGAARESSLEAFKAPQQTG